MPALLQRLQQVLREAEAHLGALGECIRGVRKAALNPRVGIMTGGPVFSQHLAPGALVEADAVASSP